MGLHCFIFFFCGWHVNVRERERERERDFSSGNDGRWTRDCRGQNPVSNDEEEKALKMEGCWHCKG